MNVLHEISTIRIKSRLGGVNCYLIETDAGFILIDTGYSTSRNFLDRELEIEGCRPGNLKLVILTHGDIDHTGNCAYVHKKYGAPIAMHVGDMGMAGRGDMSYGRKPNIILAMLLKRMPLLFGMISLFSDSSRYEGFRPDLALDEGFDLTKYGLKASVIRLPGHSAGSIGILTDEGDLFCGDLLTNMGKPELNSIMDDRSAASASVELLKGMNARTILPGHGDRFDAKTFLNSQ